MEAQQARSSLEGLLADLDRTAEALDRDPGGEGPPAQLDQAGADFATNAVDADREEASLEVVQAQRERVVAALGRLDAGSYGKCVDCGTQLTDERLEARPEAERCVECQQRYEEARR